MAFGRCFAYSFERPKTRSCLWYCLSFQGLLQAEPLVREFSPMLRRGNQRLSRNPLSRNRLSRNQPMSWGVSSGGFVAILGGQALTGIKQKH